MALRVGFGYDIHRLVPGRPFRLGCVEIPFERGPLGHSDGDVAAHAAADALLSATGLDDIGTHFPPSEPRWAGATGACILEETRRILAEHGAAVRQLDLTVVVEAPKLAPHRDRMRAAMAAALGCPLAAVSIKGRTNEGLGAIGSGAAIAAYAVVLVDTAGS